LKTHDHLICYAYDEHLDGASTQQRTERPLLSPPIKIDITNDGHIFKDSSRIILDKEYRIEHNRFVRLVGKVANRDWSQLYKSYMKSNKPVQLSDSGTADDEVESVASCDTTMTDITIAPEVSEYFADEFAQLLLHDEDIFRLLSVALEDKSIGIQKIINNLRRMIMVYARMLRTEAEVAEQMRIVSFVRRNSTLISSSVRTRIEVKHRTKMEIASSSLQHFFENVNAIELRDETQNDESDREDVEVSEDEADANLIDFGPAKSFLTSGTAWKELKKMLKRFIFPTFEDRARRLFRKWSSMLENLHPEQQQTVRQITNLVLSADLTSIQFQFSNSKHGLLNHLKGKIESWCNSPWDWWPLAPHYAELTNDEARMIWRCVGVSNFTLRLLTALKEVWTEPMCRRSIAVCREVSRVTLLAR
jgi:hypothetical protein